MRAISVFIALLSCVSSVVSLFADSISNSHLTRRHIEKPRHSHDRHTVTIRSSRNSTDDVSAEFYRGIQTANNGGTLLLKRNETYVIGKKLDLSFLNDVKVNLEGEILFTNDVDYW